MKNNKECSICGKEYHYCGTCKKANSWKVHACSEKCFQVYRILEEIREGVLTFSEAKDAFDRIKVTSQFADANFIPAVARDVKKIIDSGKTEKTVSITKK